MLATLTVLCRAEENPLAHHGRVFFDTKKAPEGAFVEEFEIVDIRSIPGGVQVFARAWKGGKQIGFGADGSVDIERFNIINPPVMVPTGTFHLEDVAVETATSSFTRMERVRDLEENPKLALLQSLASIVDAKKERVIGSKIVAGKVGRTTTTVYPAAGAVSPVDGRITEDTSTNWTTTRNNTNARIASVTNTQAGFFANVTAPNYQITRLFIGFDTSAIPDTDTISSAVFSTYITTIDANGSEQGYTLVGSTQASASTLATTDFDNLGAVSFGSSASTLSIGSYNNVTLNATGLAAISKTGLTQLAQLAYYDFTDITPIDGVSEIGEVDQYMADQTGTTNDPKLVIEHAAPSAAAPARQPAILSQ